MKEQRIGVAVEPNWTAGVAVIVSLFALWLGYKSRKDINANKALDLRLQLQREIVDTKVYLERIPDLIREVGDIRAMVGGALKNPNAQFEVWEHQRDKDLHSVKLFSEQLTLITAKQNTQTPTELEQMLGDTHTMKTEMLGIEDQYKKLKQIYDNQWGDITSLVRN